MVVDFRRTRRDHSPLAINGPSVEIVKNIKFLGVHLAENLTWTLNTSSITKRAQQHLYFLQKLREAHLPSPILTTFYRGTVESILSSCIITWFGNCTAFDRKTLQRIVKTAENIIGVSLPSITNIYITRCIQKATNIVKDPTHPSNELFTLLPSGRRYQMDGMAMLVVDQQGEAAALRWLGEEVHQASRSRRKQRKGSDRKELSQGCLTGLEPEPGSETDRRHGPACRGFVLQGPGAPDERKEFCGEKIGSPKTRSQITAVERVLGNLLPVRTLGTLGTCSSSNRISAQDLLLIPDIPQNPNHSVAQLLSEKPPSRPPVSGKNPPKTVSELHVDRTRAVFILRVDRRLNPRLFLAKPDIPDETNLYPPSSCSRRPSHGVVLSAAAAQSPMGAMSVNFTLKV
ncbi:hypothetical protein P4O66_021195 [Electrophorus voltai]|uniref:Alkylated DNA repair protein AlkB homologue 8 N-terminal domain-containing protein n=1 Tax=Electrophorus voltai TaxID=2609070 RepID=A0AAD9E2F6_9TELE|nr:hypothetical protein P4O66_021195 [Electrophorus voltai]